MLKRRILAVLLLVIMTATLTVGCTQEEKEFIDLHKEVSMLKAYENSGEFTIRINEVPNTAGNDMASIIALNLLQKGLKVNYSGKANLEQNMLDYTFSMAAPDTGIQTELLRVICKNDVLYIKIDTLLKLFAPADEFTKIFAGKEYISITKDEYLQILSGSNDVALNGLNTNGFMDQKLSNVIQKFMFGLPDAYTNFSPGAITKNGNKYTLEITGKNLAELFLNTLEYSVNNIAAIGSYISSFIGTLNKEDLALFDITPESVPMYQGFISMAIAEAQKNKTEALNNIKDMRTELYADAEVCKMLDNNLIKYSLEKKGDQQYQDTLNLTLNIEDTGEKLGMQIDVIDNIKGIAPFSINVPVNVISYSELLTKAGGTMEIEVDENYFYFKNIFQNNEDYLDVKIIEDRTYLPMRAVAEKFGEQVAWDANARKAYVIKDGAKIDMTGTIIDNRTYIKIRDFEKIGYQVEWNGEFRTVKITSPTR